MEPGAEFVLDFSASPRNDTTDQSAPRFDLRSSRSGKDVLIASADRLIISAYSEDVWRAHVLTVENLALRGFDFAVGRHAVGGNDNLLAFFGQKKVDEQRRAVRVRRIGAHEHQTRAKKVRLNRREGQRRSLFGKGQHGVQVGFDFLLSEE